MKKFNLILVVLILSIATVLLSVKSVGVVDAKTTENLDGVGAKSYIVVDENGNTLVEHNADEKREVASICKLMTTLITLEKINDGSISLDDKFLASDYACSAEGSQAFLDGGCEYKVSDLLKSVIVASANDSAIVLAENISGSEDQFVSLMNDRAEKLGMKNTKYANSTGLPAGEQFSTARDTAIILNEVSKFDIYRNDCKIWMDSLVHPSGRKTELVNTNRLIRYYPYCETGKTGFTDEAGYCLSSTARKDGLKATCVILGCENPADRFSGSVSLYNYIFANFSSEKIIDSNQIIDKKVKVVSGKENAAELKYSSDFYITLNKGDKPEISIEYELVSKAKAPISEGEKLGEAKIFVNGELVGSVDVVSANSIEKQNYKDIVGKIIDNFGFVN